MKTINLITPHYSPEITAAANRCESFVNTLTTKFKVNVITLTEIGKKGPNIENNKNNQVNYFYISQKSYNKSNFLLRFVFEFYYTLLLCLKSNRIPSDYNIVTIPYMSLVFNSSILLNRKKTVLDIRDLVWEYLDENTLFKKVVKKTLSFWCLKSIKNYLFLTVTNDAEKDYLLQKTKQQQIEVISNGISSEKFDIISSIENSSNLQKEFTVTYVGNIGLAQNLKTLVDTAQKLNEINFVVIGDGVSLENLKNRVGEKGIANINFIGKIRWEHLLPYYEKSNLLYAQLSKNYSSAIPSKLYEYLSTGLPIIYGGSGMVTQFVDKFDNFLIIPPDNKDLLIKSILHFKNKKSSFSTKNKQIIKASYLRDKTTKVLLKHLD